MPYKTIEQLPPRIQEVLPQHAQTIYKKAFNNAWEEYGKPSERRHTAGREEVAHKVAWSAVKEKYEKGEDGRWRPAEDLLCAEEESDKQLEAGKEKIETKQGSINRKSASSKGGGNHAK